MAKSSYVHKLGVEVYWPSSDGKINSSFYATYEEAETAIERIRADNARLGYTGTVDYRIRKRVPIKRSGAGRKKE